MPHQVKTLTDHVTLPNPGGTSLVIDKSQTIVTLTDEQFSAIPPGAFVSEQYAEDSPTGQSGNVYQPYAFTYVSGGPYLQDMGETSAGSVVVTTQAAYVAQVGALTSTQIAAAPTQANYNALQTDVATLRSAVNSLLTALQVTGGPEKSS